MRRRLRLGSVGLYARDRGRLAVFYQTIFDMKLIASGADHEVSQLTLDGEGSLCNINIVSNPIAVQIVFHAGSLLEMKELWERVKSNGVPARGLYVQPEGISFRFPDPEGNEIMVLCPQNLHVDDGEMDWNRSNDAEIARWVHENRKRKLEGGQV